MDQLERFAPGFRDLVVRHKVTTAAELAAYNRNYIGGDFSAGILDVRGLLQRPVVSPVPWRTPALRRIPVLLLDSAGPGVTACPGSTPQNMPSRTYSGCTVPALGLYRAPRPVAVARRGVAGARAAGG